MALYLVKHRVTFTLTLFESRDFEIFTAMKLHAGVFGVMTPCSDVIGLPSH